MTIDSERVSVYSGENRDSLPIYPLDVFQPTEKGEAEVRSAQTQCSAEALELLVLIDGQASVGDLEQQLPHIEAGALRKVLRELLSEGLIRQSTVAEETGLNLDLDAYFSTDAVPAPPASGASASADREAANGSPALARDGYYVSIARLHIPTRKLAPGEQPVVLLIDDDPDFCALVSHALGRAGFVVRVASDREQILAELRKSPLPELVLLDVNLPGTHTNGFEVLERMKKFPGLRNVPVIMTTAEATRAAVKRGLVEGADGYMTKPFKTDILIKGVRAVLGLE